MSTQHAQYVSLFLVLVIIPTGFKFYGVTRSYSSRPFLCALAHAQYILRTHLSNEDSNYKYSKKIAKHFDSVLNGGGGVSFL